MTQSSFVSFRLLNLNTGPTIIKMSDVVVLVNPRDIPPLGSAALREVRLRLKFIDCHR